MVKRSTFTGLTAVYCYGTPSKVDIPDFAMDQLRLANRFWNGLVEIQHAHEQAVAEIWASHPELAKLNDEIAQLVEQGRELKEKADAARVTGRRRYIADSDLKNELKQQREKLKAAKKNYRESKSLFYSQLKPEFTKLKDKRVADIKSLRQAFASQGLHWGTYNAVSQSFDTAAKRVSSLRASGRSSALRFHRFDGTGTWTVQLQREAGDPPRTWAAIVGGQSKWRNDVKITTEELSEGSRRKRPRTILSIRIGRQGKDPMYLSIPINIHRPIPPEAEVTQIQVTRKRVGTQFRLSAAFSLRLPTPAETKNPGTVGINFGWRSNRSDGYLRTAVWYGVGCDKQLDLREWMDKWVTQKKSVDGGMVGEIHVPDYWRRGMARMQRVRSQRDLNFNAIRSVVSRWLTAHKDGAASLASAWATEHPNATKPLWTKPADVALWRSAGRLASLCLFWREHRQSGDDEILAVFEAWRKQDRHLFEWETNGVQRLIAQRKEVYLCVAEQLASVYGRVVIDNTNFQTLTMKETRIEEADNEQADLARSQARDASPGLFREILKKETSKLGTILDIETSNGITHVHSVCDTWIDADTAQKIMLWCPVCETSFDQDENAARNLVRLATGQVTELVKS